MIKSAFSLFRSSRFQLPLVIVTFAYIMTLHVLQYRQDLYPEEIQRVLPVDAQTEELSSNITVGLHVKNFPQFSFNKNEFTMNAVVWFRFPIGSESITTVEPFEFRNAQIKKKSEPIIRLLGDDVVISYLVHVDFKTHLDYRYFPVGDHRLSIVLHNRTVTPNEVTFKSDCSNFELSNDLLLTNWLAVNKYAQTGYARSTLNQSEEDLSISHPVAAFTIDFQNNSARELITLYFPLFVMFFIGFFSLMLKVVHETRLTMIASSMPVLVLYRLVINAVSPPSATMTKIDFAYFTLVFLSLILLIFQAYVVMSLKDKKDGESRAHTKHIYYLDCLNSIMFILVLLLLNGLLTYSFLV